MWAKVGAGLSGFLAMLCFILTPLLPVTQVQSSFSWPQSGLNEVVAPLISYTPESFTATIPTSAFAEVRAGEDLVLSTVPAASKDATTRGLQVIRTAGGVDVVLRDKIPFHIGQAELAQLPADAVLNISVTKDAVTTQIPGTAFGTVTNDDLRPMVTGIYTELEATAAEQLITQGLHAEVQINSRYTSTPTPVKQAAMGLGLLLLLVSLVCVARVDRAYGAANRPLARLKGKALWLADAVVGAVLIFWHFLGANTSDDGYLLTMARVADHATYMANYYRWYGVPESPFGFPYYDLLSWWSKVADYSAWMRLPELLSAFATWYLLSRKVLPRLGEQLGTRKVAVHTSAFMFLAFWLVYNNGLRPEPIIALGALATFVAVEWAIATRRVFPIALSLVLATTSLSAGPTGLMAVAALLAGLPQFIRIIVGAVSQLKTAGSKALGATLALLGPIAAAGTWILVGAFGDQSLGAVLEAVRVRKLIGPSLNWFEEFARYQSLLQVGVDGSATRKFPVVMMFLAAGVVFLALVKHKGALPGTNRGPVVRMMIVLVGTMFVMMFTPTKWSHHFGVYAGIGAVVAAVGAVAIAQLAVNSIRTRLYFIGAVLFVLAFSITSWNGYWYVSSYGVPWWDKSISLKGVVIGTIVMGIALLVLIAGAAEHFWSNFSRERAVKAGQLAQFEAQKAAARARLRGITLAPIAVASALMVLFAMGSMAKGFISQYPAYTVGLGNLRSLTGSKCELAQDVMIETNSNASFLQPTTGTLQESLTSGTYGTQNAAAVSEVKAALAAGEKPDDELLVQLASYDLSTPSRGFTADSVSEGVNDLAAGNATKASAEAAGATTAGSTTAGATTGATSSTADTTTANDTNADEADDKLVTEQVTSKKNNEIVLPFGLNHAEVPMVGSYDAASQALAVSQWFKLPETRSADAPLVVISAAGTIRHLDTDGQHTDGQLLLVEYGKDGEVQGRIEPIDVGPTLQWRNLRVPLTQIPADATEIRIVAGDSNVDDDQWLAFTPPRVPNLASMTTEYGEEQAGLLDWAVALQFPCQRTFDHYAGVAEVPTFRVEPDNKGKPSLSPWMDYDGGGSVGLLESTVRKQEVATYLRDDWDRDWGTLDKLSLYENSQGQTPAKAQIDYTQVQRSGWWNPGKAWIEKKE